MLEPGDRAPAFTLPDQNGDPVKLADFKGQTVVLYLYPRRGLRLTLSTGGQLSHRGEPTAIGSRI